MEKIPSASEIYPREEVILEEFKTGSGKSWQQSNSYCEPPQILELAAPGTREAG